MPDVKALCEETRYIGLDRYIKGATYTLDAERCGKYKEAFRPVTDTDRVEAEAAWARRMDAVQMDAEIRNEINNMDPSLVKAAIVAIQGEIAKAAQTRMTQRLDDVEEQAKAEHGPAVASSKR